MPKKKIQDIYLQLFMKFNLKKSKKRVTFLMIR